MKKISKKVKYVNEIKEKGYPLGKKNHYEDSHRHANAAEKKHDKKMFNAETKAERKLKPGTLMATHKKNGSIEIEKKYKKFTPDLKVHEFTEWKENKKLCSKCHKSKSEH